MSEIVYLNDRYQPYYIIRESADGKYMAVRPLSEHNAGCWVEATKVRHTGRYL